MQDFTRLLLHQETCYRCNTSACWAHPLQTKKLQTHSLKIFQLSLDFQTTFYETVYGG